MIREQLSRRRVLLAAGAALIVGGFVGMGFVEAAGALPSEPGPPAAGCDAGAKPPALLPDGCWGTYPTSRYQIGADMSGESSTSRSMHFGMTLWTFNLGKSAVQFTLWSIEWALVGFDARDHDDAVGEGASNFDDLLISHAQLPFVALAWLAMFGWAGYRMLRGHAGPAVNDILLSLVLTGLFTVLVDDLGRYMDATWDLTDTTSSALLVAAHGEDPAAGGTTRQAQVEAVEDLQHDLHVAFVELPYDHLNWGRSLGAADDPGNGLRACARVRDDLLATRPHDGSAVPQLRMRAAGEACTEVADYNLDPSWERMFGALVVMTASFVLMAVLALLALTVVVAKLLLLLAFVLTPFAALAAILPGQARRLAWSWVAAVGQLVGAVVISSLLLSLVVLFTQSLLGLTASLPPLERFAVLLALVLLIHRFRRQFLQRSRALAASMGDWLASLPLPGPRPAFQHTGPDGRAHGPATGAGAAAGSGAAVTLGNDRDSGLLEIDRLGGWVAASAVAVAVAPRAVGESPNVADQVADETLSPSLDLNPVGWLSGTIAERLRERRWQRRRERYFRRVWLYSLRTFRYSRRTWTTPQRVLGIPTGRRVPHHPHHPGRPNEPMRPGRLPTVSRRGQMVNLNTLPRRHHAFARRVARARARREHAWFRTVDRMRDVLIRRWWA